MKYQIKNGILHEDGRPVFALGASYYPSFHPAKYQVPPDGDRIGEMKKDLRRMKAAGLNWFRTAALAEVAREDGEVTVSSDFIDAMCAEADDVGMAASVRLNGYFVNLSGNTDYEFVKQDGQPMIKRWNYFMESSLYHEGATADSLAATRALAKHFAAYPSVVSYQIFNEPHYPYEGIYDYHPNTIAAYRKWLVERGIMSEEAARDYDPPRARPQTKAGIPEWVNWRLFSIESMSRYLDMHGKAAREVCPDIDTYTCYTGAPIECRAPVTGITYFDDASNLTTQAVTHYINFDGADYFPASYQLALAESSAALTGRRAWVAELDKRIHMPASKFTRSVLETIGLGLKGINFYEWRGDYPGEGTPLSDNCGFIHYDGTPTDTFDACVKVLAMINRYSTEIVTAEKLRQGVAVLHSDRAQIHGDALTDYNMGGQNPWVFLTLQAYRGLKKCGFAPDIVRAEDLRENRLGVKVLFLPALLYLTKEEHALIRAFQDAGGEVWYADPAATFCAIAIDSWWHINDKPKDRTCFEFRGGREMEDVMPLLPVKPPVGIADRNLFAHVLTLADGGRLVVLVSNKPGEAAIASQRITFDFPAEAVRFCTPDGEAMLPVEDGGVTLPEFADGALLFIH